MTRPACVNYFDTRYFVTTARVTELAIHVSLSSSDTSSPLSNKAPRIFCFQLSLSSRIYRTVVLRVKLHFSEYRRITSSIADNQLLYTHKLIKRVCLENFNSHGARIYETNQQNLCCNALTADINAVLLLKRSISRQKKTRNQSVA